MNTCIQFQRSKENNIKTSTNNGSKLYNNIYNKNTNKDKNSKITMIYYQLINIKLPIVSLLWYKIVITTFAYIKNMIINDFYILIGNSL